MMTEIGFLALSGILFMLLGANHADAKEVSPRPEKSIDEEKLRKRNKAVSLAAAIILVALLFFGVMFTFAEPNTWLSSHPTGYTTDNPPPENIGIYIVTEKDFTATPVLRKLVDRWSASIPITDDPIVKIKNPHALSGAEAYAITEKYGNGYLLYEGIYYSFGIVVS